jgi:glycosyltransferase involved in cell wall biosynthesis
MSVHLVTPEYPPRHGGVADYTHQIATELARAGIAVHVWGPSGSAAPENSSVVVHPELGRFRPADLRRTSRCLDEFAAPRRLVVQWVPHGYGQRAMNLPFCLWLWGRSVTGDAIDLVVHEPFVSFSGSVRQRALAAMQRAMTLVLLSAARRVWVTTRAWVPELEPYMPAQGIATGWLPVPSSLPVPDAVAVDAVRARYVNGTAGLVGHFGTHGPLVTSLLDEAIVQLANAEPSVRFLLVGAGSDAYRSALVARGRIVAGRVNATGTLSPRDLSAHLAACDVLLQPYPDGVTSRRTTTMAGLFCRVPVVTTQGRLTEPLWQDGGAVRLVPVGDVRALVDEVVGLLNDPEERRRQAAAGRTFYDRWFDVRHTVAALSAS